MGTTITFIGFSMGAINLLLKRLYGKMIRNIRARGPSSLVMATGRQTTLPLNPRSRSFYYQPPSSGRGRKFCLVVGYYAHERKSLCERMRQYRIAYDLISPLWNNFARETIVHAPLHAIHRHPSPFFFLEFAKNLRRGKKESRGIVLFCARTSNK